MTLKRAMEFLSLVGMVSILIAGSLNAEQLAPPYGPDPSGSLERILAEDHIVQSEPGTAIFTYEQDGFLHPAFEYLARAFDQLESSEYPELDISGTDRARFAGLNVLSEGLRFRLHRRLVWRPVFQTFIAPNQAHRIIRVRVDIGANQEENGEFGALLGAYTNRKSGIGIKNQIDALMRESFASPPYGESAGRAEKTISIESSNGPCRITIWQRTLDIALQAAGQSGEWSGVRTISSPEAYINVHAVPTECVATTKFGFLPSRH